MFLKILYNQNFTNILKCRNYSTQLDDSHSKSQIPKRIRQKGTSTLSGTLAYQPRMDGTDLPNAASGKRRQMSGSQIPKRIRQNWTSTFSGTLALGQGRTRGISQMPPQENDRGSQANVQILNTKEDKAKEDKYIVSPKCQRKMSKIFQ